MRIEEIIKKIRNNEIENGDIIQAKIDNTEELLIYDGDNLVLKGTDIPFLDEWTLCGLLEFEFLILDNYKSDELELRGNNTFLSKKCKISEGDTLEIVEWKDDNENNCITIGYWVMDDMGFNFRFVNDRFIYISQDSLLELLEIGQNILNNKYKNVVKHQNNI